MTTTDGQSEGHFTSPYEYETTSPLRGEVHLVGLVYDREFTQEEIDFFRVEREYPFGEEETATEA